MKRKKLETSEEIEAELEEFEKWRKPIQDRLNAILNEKFEIDLKGDDSTELSEKAKKLQEKIRKKEELIRDRIYQTNQILYGSGKSSEAQKKRRERTHHLCEIGGIVEKSGLGKLELDVLLGLLLQQAKQMKETPEIVSRWKEIGKNCLLEERQEVCEAQKEKTPSAPQRGAEAQQGSVSSASPVERAGEGLGSPHGAVERREGAPAAVRPEGVSPAPQKAEEAQQREGTLVDRYADQQKPTGAKRWP